MTAPEIRPTPTSQNGTTGLSRRTRAEAYLANASLILGLLLALALTGLPRLAVSLAMHYDSHDSYGTLAAPRPLFFDKVSSSSFTLTRPKDSTLSTDVLDPPLSGAFSSHISGQVELMPRWQRTLFTAAERHKANYV